MNRTPPRTAYPPLGDVQDDTGDLLDIVDPFRIRKVPGAIKDKVDHYVDAKTTAASQKVAAGVRSAVKSAISDTTKNALYFAAGSALIGAVWGGVAVYEHRQKRRRAS